jgi:uncharacterized phage protein (TIGR01671 family)
MKEIKFRAWDRVNGQMVEVMSLTRAVQTPFTLVRYYDDGVLKKITEAVLTVNLDFIQYTGLKDKNEVEIYDGSILMDPSWWWGPRFVYLNQGECGPCEGDSVMSYILAKNIENPQKEATHNIWNGREVEVIGNIYENPELLSEE